MKGFPWAIRTVSRAALIDDLLVHHYGFGFADTCEADARGELEALLERWLDLGLGHARGADGGLLFDPAEAFDFAVQAGRAGKDDFWERHYVATERAQVEEMRSVPGNKGWPPCYQVGIARSYDLGDLAAGTKVRLRMPLPIEDHALDDLTLAVEAPPGAVLRQDIGRLDAGFVLAAPGQVTLGVTASFTAHGDRGSGGTLSNPQRDLYTRGREGLICVSPRIRREAEALVAGVAGDAGRVAAIFRFLDRFEMGGTAYHDLDPDAPCDWPFTSGFFDCQLGTALICAMCRAVGIPARIASGYQLYRPNPGYHYWAEIWTDDGGWRSFDASNWHLSRGGRDRDWSGVFAGWLDYRMKVQVLPEIFTGAGSRRFPPAWHMLRRRIADGMETRFVDAHSGALVYRDRVEIRSGPQDASAAGHLAALSPLPS